MIDAQRICDEAESSIVNHQSPINMDYNSDKYNAEMINVWIKKFGGRHVGYAISFVMAS